MSLSSEGNTSLAYDTDALRQYAEDYGKVATDLQTMAEDLDKCLKGLIGNGAGDKTAGWSTPAGVKFNEMVDENWQHNMKMYVDLLNKLKDILLSVATEYEALTTKIESTKIK